MLIKTQISSLTMWLILRWFSRETTITNNNTLSIIDFLKKENQLNFWFISKNKEEPRLANRFDEVGSDLEQPLAIARDIKKLYDAIKSSKDNLKISEFLSQNSDLRHVVRRAFIVEKFPSKIF